MKRAQPDITNDPKVSPAAGIPIDANGGATIDPTKNVLDLVRAESKYQDSMRDAVKENLVQQIIALKELMHTFQKSVEIFQNSQREAETKRIDQLAQTRQEFQNTIRDMLAESVRTTSTLVSDQLKQIQATFDNRVSKLEAGAFTQAGKQSERDPAVSDAIARMASSISALKQDTDERMARFITSSSEQAAKLTAAVSAIGTKEARSESSRMGQGQVIAWIIGAAMLMAAIATPLIAFLSLRGK